MVTTIVLSHSDNKLRNFRSSDDEWLQNVMLGTDFGERKVEVVEIEDGWAIRSNASNQISFTTDVDSENFSSIYVKRKFTHKEATVTDCLFLDPQNHNWYEIMFYVARK